MSYENYVKFKFNCSVNKVLLKTAPLIWSNIVNGCICSTPVELNGVAGGMACKT